MPLLGDEEMLAAYKAVLAEWQFTGYVVFDPMPAGWIRENLSNYSQKEIARLMYDNRDDIDQTKETREGHRDHYDHHYDFRFYIGKIRIYIETVFDYDGCNEEDSTIRVVRVKPA